MSLHARFGGGGGCGSGGRLDRAPPAQIVRTKRVRACIFRRVGETFAGPAGGTLSSRSAAGVLHLDPCGGTRCGRAPP